MINRDVMNQAAPKAVSSTCMEILMGIQEKPKEIQAMAAAGVFLHLAEHLDTPAQDLFTAVKNLMNNNMGRRPEFEAIAAYLDGEL